MTSSPNRLPAALAICLGALAIGIGAVNADSSPDPIGDLLAAVPLDPVRCEIRAVPSGGAVALEAVVVADVAVSGIYQFHVSGSGAGGSQNIRQGGPFQIDAGSDAVLGRVTLGNQGASYDVRLSLDTNGDSIDCAGRIGSPV